MRSSSTAPGRRAALPDRPAAGKTGTTQDFRDAWFVGYTSQLTAGVWIGNDDGKPMNRATGGSLPAEIWNQVMRVAHEGKAPTALPGTMISSWTAAPDEIGDGPTAASAGPRVVQLREELPWLARRQRTTKYIRSCADRFRWVRGPTTARIRPRTRLRVLEKISFREAIAATSKWRGTGGRHCPAGAGRGRARVEAAR